MLPMPNDVLDGKKVIASCWINDDYKRDDPEAEIDKLGLVLLLNPSPPFYTVAQIVTNDSEPWQLVHITDAFNINIAVDVFADHGGDV